MEALLEDCDCWIYYASVEVLPPDKGAVRSHGSSFGVSAGTTLGEAIDQVKHRVRGCLDILLLREKPSLAWMDISHKFLEARLEKGREVYFKVLPARPEDGPRGKRSRLDKDEEQMWTHLCLNKWEDVNVSWDKIIKPLPRAFTPMEAEEEDDEEVSSDSFNLRLLNLGGNMAIKSFWVTNSPPQLLERKCYLELWTSRVKPLFEQERVAILLIGNPGVGKTGFLLYVLVMLLAEKKEVLLQDKSGRCVYFSWETGQCTCSRVTSYDDVRLNLDSEIHFLVDGQLPIVPPFGGKALLTCTPLKSNFKEFSKDGTCHTFYLPQWSAEELSLLRETNFQHVSFDMLEKRYSEWGGVARYVLMAQGPQMSDVLSCLPTLGDIVRAVADQRADGQHPSHKVLYMKVKKGFERFDLQFASPYVRDGVLKAHYHDSAENLKVLLQFNGAALLGFGQLQGAVLERYFKTVAVGRKTFRVREVFPNKDPLEMGNVSFDFGQVKEIKLLDEVKPCEDSDMIIWPSSPIQETVDSFVLKKHNEGHILQAFQVTLSAKKDSHGLKVAGLLKLMEEFKLSAQRVEIYIVTTAERYQVGGYQRWRTKGNLVVRSGNIVQKLEGVRQFVLDCGAV